MTRRDISMVLMVIALASAYCFYFTDLFRKKTIQIVPQNRFTIRPDAVVNPVSFSLDGKYQLTDVKVYTAASLQTNKRPQPIWHLVTTSNSAPVKGFLYGFPIEGMKCGSDKPKPEPLVADTAYRLILQAGKARGEADFRPIAGPGAQ